MVRFDLENKGTRSLKIRKIDLGGCGCLKPVAFKQKIKKGGRVAFLFRLDATQLMGWQSHGISLVTNDPQNHLINLRIEGNIVRDEKKID